MVSHHIMRHTHIQGVSLRIQMRIISNDGGMKGSSIDDWNCCTIRSIAIAFKIPFQEAYMIGRKAGRQHGKGFHLSLLMFYLQCKTQYRFKLVKLKSNGLTIRRFLEQHPIGRFVCGRRGHAFAIVHGEIQDATSNTERQIVQEAYEVIE
jgi:hypothetical protein